MMQQQNSQGQGMEKTKTDHKKKKQSSGMMNSGFMSGMNPNVMPGKKTIVFLLMLYRE